MDYDEGTFHMAPAIRTDFSSECGALIKALCTGVVRALTLMRKVETMVIRYTWHHVMVMSRRCSYYWTRAPTLMRKTETIPCTSNTSCNLGGLWMARHPIRGLSP